MSIFKDYKKYCLLGAILILLVVCGCKKKTYSITFKDSDHTILKTIEVEKGEIPIYVGTPEKDSDELYDYTFFSWDKDLVEANEDTEYIAIYKSTLKNPIGDKNNQSGNSLINSGDDDEDESLDEKAYYITFLDDTGIILQKSLFVTGETPYYKTGIPASKIVGDYIYTFSNWDKTIVPVSGAAEYKAVYAMQSFSDTLPTSITNPESTIKQCKVSLSSNNSSFGYCNGGGTYDSGTEVTLRAIPNPGYVFLYWKEDGSNNPERTFIAKNDITYTAVFGENAPKESEETVLIAAIIYPDGVGYVEGVGIYPKGSLVTLTAKPNTYKYVFDCWNSHSKIENPNSESFSFIADEDIYFFPNFKLSPDLITITAETSNVNMGTVTIENKENDNKYALNSVVKLVATPKDNYQFDCWRDENNNVVSTSPQYDHQVLKNEVLKAYFEEKTKYPINIIVSPEHAGSVTIKGGDINQLFLYGTELELEAIPSSSSFVFSGWEDLSIGDDGRTQSTRTIEVSKSNNYVAKFSTADSFFKELEYIDCNGASYIDTGFKPDQDSRIVIYGSDMEPDVNYFLGSTRSKSGSTTSKNFEVGLVTSSKGYRVSYGSQQKVISGFDINSLKNDFVADMDKNKYYFNNNLLHEFSTTTFKCDYSFYLFGLNENGAPFADKSQYHLKKCEIYDNGELVRNLIPMIRTMDDAVGLYDTVNNKFYRPVISSSSILTGEEVQGGEQIVANRYRINVFSNDPTKGTVSCSHEYAYEGDFVDISATPASGYVFLNWDDGSQDTTRKIEVHGDINLICNFGSPFEKDYTVLDGIRSTGTQYIDTEFFPSFNSKIVVTGRNITQPTDTNDDVLFGASYEGNEYYRFTVNKSTDKPLVFKYTGNSVLNYEGISKDVITNSRFSITMDINSSALSFNTKDITVNYAGDTKPTPGSSLYIFANNNSGTADSFSSYVLSSFQMYNYSSVSNNYTLLLDFVPVKRNSDNKVGLYEKKTDKFYENKGTGDFVEDIIVQQPKATISVSSNDPSLGTVTGGGIFDINTPHTLTATAKTNCVFLKWSDGVTTASRSVTPTESKTYYYTAIFGEKFEDQYTSLDYLETDGKQYIDLGIPFVDGYSIDAKFKPTKTPGSDRYLFGTAYTTDLTSGDALLGSVNYSLSNGQLKFKTIIGDITLSDVSCTDNWNTYSLEYISAKKYSALIGSSEETASYTKALNSKNIFLFNNADIGSDTGFIGKLSRFSILNSSNVYIMDLVPVTKNNTGQMGLYDRIGGKFYVAQSAKDFVDKTRDNDSNLANYTKLNSISSTENGKQIIKTGVYPSSKTRIILNVTPKSKGAIFYSKKDTNSYSLVLDGTSSYLTLGSTKFKINEEGFLNNDLNINVYQGVAANIVGDDTLVVESDEESGLDATYSTIDDELVLFGKGSLTDFCVMDIRGVSIYDDSRLVRNYIPVIDPNGRVGLFDTVNNAFYENGNPDGSSFVANKDADVLTYNNLEWITLNANTYIDTGIKGGAGVGISACFEPLSATSAQYIGVVSDEKSFVIGADFEADKGFYVSDADNNEVYLSDSAKATTARKVTIDYCYSSINRSFELSSGKDPQATLFSDSFDNIYIGKANGSTSSQGAKYYSIKIKQNNLLVRDFIPVLNNESNKIGLYDKIGEKFYPVAEADSTNKSSKVLKKGDIIILDGQTKDKNDKYIVVGFKNNKALLMSHNEGIKADFSGLNSSSYVSSNIGQLCNDFYNNIKGTNKKAIVPTEVRLMKYEEDLSLNNDAHVSSAKLSSATLYATYSTDVYVYPLTVSDVETYFGGSDSTASTSLTSQGLKELFPTNDKMQYIRLFSLKDNENSYVVLFDCAGGVTWEHFISSSSAFNVSQVADAVIYPAFLYDYNSENASYHLYADEYNSIEYIENRSNQYIDLGIACDRIKSVDLRFSLIKDNQDQILFGAYTDSKSDKGSNYAQYNNNKFYIYGSATSNKLKDGGISLNTIYRVTTPVSSKGTAYLYNESDNTTNSVAINKVNTESLNMFLFTLNRNGYPSPVHNTMMRVYSFKIYGLDGNVIMNLKPAERASDHVIGLLDEVSGKFFTDSNINGKFYKGDYESVSNSAVNTYEKLECITSTGTQYIDIGKVLPRVSKIETKFITSTVTSNSTPASMFGSYKNSSPWTHLMCFNNLYHANKSIKTVFENNKLYTVTSDFDASNNWYVTINDKTYETKGIDAEIDDATYKLFAGGRDGNYKAKGSIYYFKIWENNELTFDLIPAKRMSDGVIGMLNLINNQFYTNKGSGTFTGTSKDIPEYIRAEDDYVSVEYIESSGVEYIDTEVKNVTNNTRLVVTASALDDAKSIFGINGGGALQFNYTGVAGKDKYRFADVEKDLDNIYRRQIYTYDLYKGLKITDSTGSVVYNDRYGTLTNTLNIANYSIYLFSRNGSTGSNDQGRTRIYSCKIYNGTTLIRDFVPVRRISDDELGLYDKVNQKFYSNAATSGKFTTSSLSANVLMDYSNIEKYYISGIPSDYSMGSVTGSGSYNKDASVTLTAVAKEGYRFSHWSDTSTNATKVFNAESSVSYTAYFERLPVKGDIITLNDDYKYRVVSVNDNKYLVVRMSSIGSSGFDNISNFISFGGDLKGGSYVSSYISRYLSENWYTSMIKSVKNSVLQTILKQSYYSISNGNNLWYKDGVKKEDKITSEGSGTYSFVRKSSTVITLTQNVFLLDVDDIFSYFGNTSVSPQDLIEFFTGDTNAISDSRESKLNVLLRTASNTGFTSLSLGSGKFNEVPYNFVGQIYPAFTIDIDNSLLSYTIENSDIYAKKIISAHPKDEHLGTVTGGGRYVDGTVVTLKAIPNLGCQFVKWADNDSIIPEREITVSSDKEYVAIFSQSLPNKGEIIELADYTNKKYMGYGEYTVLSVSGNNAVLLSRDHCIEPAAFSSTSSITDYASSTLNSKTNIRLSSSLKKRYSSSILNAIVPTDIISRAYDSTHTSTNAINIEATPIKQFGSNSIIAESYALDINDIMQFFGVNSSTASTVKPADIIELFNLSAFPSNYLENGIWLRSLVNTEGTTDSAYCIKKDGKIYTDIITNSKASCYAFTINLKDPNIAYKLKGALTCTPNWVTSTCTVIADSLGGGHVEGAEEQIYNPGHTLFLKAVADDGYVFSRWTDGVTIPSRTITTYNKSIHYTAVFTKNTTLKKGLKISFYNEPKGKQDYTILKVNGQLLTLLLAPDPAYVKDYVTSYSDGGSSFIYFDNTIDKFCTSSYYNSMSPSFKVALSQTNFKPNFYPSITMTDGEYVSSTPVSVASFERNRSSFVPDIATLENYFITTSKTSYSSLDLKKLFNYGPDINYCVWLASQNADDSVYTPYIVDNNGAIVVAERSAISYNGYPIIACPVITIDISKYGQRYFIY